MSPKLLYFAYGSNLLKERIHIQNPTAVFKTTARLDDYKLEFDFNSKRWHGAAATVTESPGSHVWGVVWELESDQLHHLDKQEGVEVGVYKPIEVKVTTPQNEELDCRSYYLLKRGDKDRRPSPQYIGVIRKGAAENNLPSDYVEFLRKIEDNGYQGEIEVKVNL
ncbi:hypothetical protein CAPTEDRAFT_224905 [Capitella teleta]|uniref:gamma-glutamylcyclotransferase n=1 Tax=Capitella teleta TaxID=283909 RepID=R7V851_CAPTE|nr:hypothetical protein CAPTEDRAFT_224905 [Capitella teleta]|eukprot:ELU14694.1 hypothetical protein CAPTEDRAFT_224905 [Capitella teleta]